ncbi:hypothetical protein WM40_04855 [Robbsia andropogonis]|uniref:Uncharacterized protein n=1 Tax=Robbsia andropogonis TaxID=28092 RepID=A0A0F5K3L7_9BURK|nr:hypothetical protein WM40_04855 [Robbsia andropogonis]
MRREGAGSRRGAMRASDDTVREGPVSPVTGSGIFRKTLLRIVPSAAFREGRNHGYRPLLFSIPIELVRRHVPTLRADTTSIDPEMVGWHFPSNASFQKQTFVYAFVRRRFHAREVLSIQYA